MDRALWTRELGKHYCPPWPCPVCRKGTTVLIKESLAYQETVPSARLHQDENFDPEWIEFVFTAWARCTHPSCKQEFAISGTGGVAPQYISEDDWEYEEYFAPKACHPMPNIIELPPKCPEDVALELKAAFSLFWSHPAACASRIRVALEHLMNHIGVPKRKKGKNAKFFDLTLHARIEAYATKVPAIGSQLMALKWVGNTGSHDSSVSPYDLLDAFEILEHALREIIGGHSAKVAALAKRLTKKHGGK